MRDSATLEASSCGQFESGYEEKLRKKMRKFDKLKKNRKQQK